MWQVQGRVQHQAKLQREKTASSNKRGFWKRQEGLVKIGHASRREGAGSQPHCFARAGLCCNQGLNFVKVQILSNHNNSMLVHISLHSTEFKKKIFTFFLLLLPYLRSCLESVDQLQARLRSEHSWPSQKWEKTAKKKTSVLPRFPRFVVCFFPSRLNASPIVPSDMFPHSLSPSVFLHFLVVLSCTQLGLLVLHQYRPAAIAVSF